jgi:short-subunit dehydrogenase
LVLVDFNATQLESTKNKIQKENPETKIKTKVMDLTTLKAQTIYDDLEKELNDVKITVLVNNAGVGEPAYGMKHGFYNHPLRDICLTSDLNALVPTILYKMILPKMEAQKLGLCIMMGSAAGMSPLAALPMYGATKSYVMHLTKALRNRYPHKTTGINFHLFTPHFIQTGMTSDLELGPDWFKNGIFPPDVVWVKSAMRTLNQKIINEDFAGTWMHESLCAMQRNFTWLNEKTSFFQYYCNYVCTGWFTIGSQSALDINVHLQLFLKKIKMASVETFTIRKLK